MRNEFLASRFAFRVRSGSMRAVIAPRSSSVRAPAWHSGVVALAALVTGLLLADRAQASALPSLPHSSLPPESLMVNRSLLRSGVKLP